MIEFYFNFHFFEVFVLLGQLSSFVETFKSDFFDLFILFLSLFNEGLDPFIGLSKLIGQGINFFAF